MTASAVMFDATDKPAAIVAIDSLSIDANDRIITYNAGTNKVVVVKIPIA